MDGPPNYSTTMSALTSTDVGKVMPIARAVFRLIASSNVVGCSIGISPGFAAFQYPVHEAGQHTVDGVEIRPIGHEAAGIDVFARIENRRQAVLVAKRDHAPVVGHQDWIAKREKAVELAVCGSLREDLRQSIARAHVHDVNFETQLLCGLFGVCQPLPRLAVCEREQGTHPAQ